jgi:agmatinase
MKKTSFAHKPSPSKKPIFDPNETASAEFGIFGLPYTYENAKLILLPVPWEVTTSYGRGAANGPKIIRAASEQIDLFDLDTGKAYEAGYFMMEIPANLMRKNKALKAKAQKVIRLRTAGQKTSSLVRKLTDEVNAGCREMTNWVYTQTQKHLNAGKIPGLIGGDHSTPLGAIRAISERLNGDFGILHIDAHADLRRSYQDFEQSHASIMYNVINLAKSPRKLVQVGIRDFCEEEYQLIQSEREKISTFFDGDLKKHLHSGTSWKSLCERIISQLPKRVYISFDIDGLNPALCPSTGTPVPGGLDLDQVNTLFREIKEQGKQIIGFDLNEVSSGSLAHSEWDGNVGARVLYKLCGWTMMDFSG